MDSRSLHLGRRLFSLFIAVFMTTMVFSSGAITVNALMDDSYYKKTYGVTYYELFTKYPQYLNNQSFNRVTDIYISQIDDCIDTYGSSDSLAVVLSSIHNGAKINITNMLSLIRGSDYNYENQLRKKTAESFIKTLSDNDDSFKSTADDVSKKFKEFGDKYDVLTGCTKAQYKAEIKNTTSYIPDEIVDSIVDDCWSYIDDLKAAAGNALDAVDWATIILGITDVDYGIVYKLYNTVDKETDLYSCLQLLVNENQKIYTDGLIDRIIDNKLIKKISSKVSSKNIVKELLGKESSFSAFLVDYGMQQMEDCYGWADAEDIVECLAYRNYIVDLYTKIVDYRIGFASGVYTVDDIGTYHLLYDAYLSAISCAAESCKNMTSDWTYMNNITSMYDAGSLSYDTYIEWCMKALKKDVDAGVLVLDDVKDEVSIAQESAEKIKTRFAEFQAQYPVGTNWYGSYGGGIQCYGFAKMCFAYIFGVDIPCYDYNGGKRYQFTPSDSLVAVGQLTGYDNATADDVKALFAKAKLGDVIQSCSGGDSQHTMIFVSAADTGAVVYDCNVGGVCDINQYTLSYQWMADNYCTNGTSLAGVTIYRSYNYAKLLGTKAFEIDDSANFVISDGVLTKYNGSSSVVVIPDEVTSIGSKAFQNNTAICYVRMNSNITSIGEYAFSGCTNLITIDMPDSITSIGSYAFQNCSRLSSIKVPEPIKTVNSCTWYGCSSAVSLDMSDNVVTIQSSAFYKCTNLSSVKLSKSLETLAINAFGDCDKLTNIEIPKSLTSGGGATQSYSGAFANCSNLKNVNFERGTTRIANNLFAYCDGLEEITIPDTVTLIESEAFYNCTNLKNVVFSENLLTIQASAFSNCTALSEVVIPDSVITISSSAFYKCANLSDVTLSKSLETLGINAFGDCDKLTNIEIPKSLTSGGGATQSYSGAFANCSNLKNVNFERGTTRIANNLFAYCDGLEEITIPDTVTLIESEAFYNCSNLKNVVMPNGLRSIENNAFSYCVSLGSVYVPDTVDSMGTSIFSNCSKLKTAHLPNIRVNLKASTFYGCVKLEEVNLPDTLSAIENSAFYQCKSLREIIIPEGVTTLGKTVFYDCEALETVVLPDGLTSMGTECFRECTLLENVTIGRGLKTIPTGTFRGTFVNNIVIPDTVTKINDYAFGECVNLKKITIPKSVTSISSNNVFSYPKKMTIYGTVGSYAETYASDRGITFVQIGDVSISEQPKNITVIEGFDMTVSITPSSSDLTCQWYVNGGSGWTLLNGETDTTLIVRSVNAKMNGLKYRCTISDGSIMSTSDYAVLTVTPSSAVTLSQVRKMTIDELIIFVNGIPYDESILTEAQMYAVQKVLEYDYAATA